MTNGISPRRRWTEDGKVIVPQMVADWLTDAQRVDLPFADACLVVGGMCQRASIVHADDPRHLAAVARWLGNRGLGQAALYVARYGPAPAWVLALCVWREEQEAQHGGLRPWDAGMTPAKTGAVLHGELASIAEAWPRWMEREEAAATWLNPLTSPAVGRYKPLDSGFRRIGGGDG